MNYKLTIQYDGTDFHGWQMQGELRTVQGELHRALSLIEGREVIVHGSGRTDAGVHAQGQVASVKLARALTPQKLRAAINGNVERDLRIMEVEVVPDEFHARYSAKGKTYVYRIINESFISPFWVRYAHMEARRLDVAAMNSAAGIFCGTHDWTAFSAAQSDVGNRTRTITQLKTSARHDDLAHGQLVEIMISANGFLRYMVRSIVGTLLAIGRGEVDDEIPRRAIESQDRSIVAATAPASGLTLLSVHY